MRFIHQHDNTLAFARLLLEVRVLDDDALGAGALVAAADADIRVGHDVGGLQGNGEGGGDAHPPFERLQIEFRQLLRGHLKGECAAPLQGHLPSLPFQRVGEARRLRRETGKGLRQVADLLELDEDVFGIVVGRVVEEGGSPLIAEAGRQDGRQ